MRFVQFGESYDTEHCYAIGWARWSRSASAHALLI
jgi:hypothetical protein